MANLSSQFKGLPMDELIGGPLNAACDAQLRLARATENFIQMVGFRHKEGKEGEVGEVEGVRTATFSFSRPTDGAGGSEDVEIEVPLLSIVKIPNLSIDTVDVTFDMEVKSSTSTTVSADESASVSAQAGVGWGPYKASVTVQGSVSAHQEHTRKTDNSAKYHVEVHASDGGTPEGLARVLDILQTAAAPKKISSSGGEG